VWSGTAPAAPAVLSSSHSARPRSRASPSTDAVTARDVTSSPARTHKQCQRPTPTYCSHQHTTAHTCTTPVTLIHRPHQHTYEHAHSTPPYRHRTCDCSASPLSTRPSATYVRAFLRGAGVRRGWRQMQSDGARSPELAAPHTVSGSLLIQGR
jgi:hypothetical protein